MGRRSWKRVAPNSLRHAMELCLEYGREKRNLSVDRVADLMGLPSKWTLYKWLESGRMPAVLARFYQGRADAAETLAALTGLMSQIAGHRENVGKAMTPELGLFEEAEG